MTGSYPDVVPLLSDDLVLLRAHRPEDVDRIVEQSNDPASVRWTTVPQPYGPPQAMQWMESIAARWQSDGSRAWAIEAPLGTGPADPVDRQTSVASVASVASAGSSATTAAAAAHRGYAGSVELRPRGAGVFEVAFGLHPRARGTGVMARAVRLVSTYAFDELGAGSVRWMAVVGNWSSRRVAWACGFRIEGTVRDLLDHRGEPLDGWVGTLRKGDPMTPASRWLEPVELTGRSVRLRPWREDDRPPQSWTVDSANQRFMPGLVPTYDTFPEWLGLLRERAAVGEAIVWCVADPRSDEAMGALSCFRLNAPMTVGSAEVGYWLYPKSRGRGVIDEAVGLLVDHAFTAAGADGLGLRRLSARVDIENTASARVLLRNGFRLVGTERVVLAREGQPATDGVLFDLLPADPRRAARAPLSAPVLELGEVRLRPWRDDDVPAEDQVPDAAALRFMPPGAQPTRQQFASWLATRRLRMAQGNCLLWCIADAGDDRPLGQVVVFGIDVPTPGNAELGYWLYPSARGRGLALAAARGAVRHAFAGTSEGGLGLHRLQAMTNAENEASQTVLARVGFRSIGTEHAAYRLDPEGPPTAGSLFELLASG